MLQDLHLLALPAKVAVPAHQFLPLSRYILEASFHTLSTWVIKISSMGQSELGNL